MTVCRVSFACNSYRDGSFLGQFECVEFDISGQRVVSITGLAVPLFFGEATMRVDKATIPLQSRRRWVGNWCWDSCMMSLDNARTLLSFLLARGWDVDDWCNGGAFADMLPALARDGGSDAG